MLLPETENCEPRERREPVTLATAHSIGVRGAHIAQLALQLYFSYLTEGLFKLLNDTVREKFFVRTFPQREKFCASMPICSGVRGKSTRKLLGFRGCSENLVFIP